MNFPHEYLGERKYYAVKPGDYDAMPGGSYLKFEGTIEDRPVIRHLKSNILLRYHIETNLTVSGIEIKYEGPAFLRKGEKVTVWGRKHAKKFYAVRIEADDVVIQIS